MTLTHPVRSQVRASSLIEVLVACLILSIALVGFLRVFQVNYNLAREARLGGVSGQISRAEIERAKVWGYDYLPYGTFVAGTPPTGTWAGAFDATSNGGAGGWTTGGVTYYDINGVQTTSASATKRFTMTDSLIDAGSGPSYQVLKNGTTYTLDYFATRTLVVTVADATSGSTLLSSGTVLVEGGL
jgi:type II secretory pathway pseudopilin PulG